jgi:hypothetical protein
VHTGGEMKDLYATYRDAVNDVWRGWWIAWPLSKRVALGDVLHKANGQVRPAGTLTDQGIPFAACSGTPHNDYMYDTQGSASVQFKTAGAAMDGVTALAVADFGAVVRFEKNNSALIIYRTLTETGVTNERALATELVRLTWDKWDNSLLAVAHVINAASGTILTSAGSSASAELRLQAGAGQAQLGLADLAGRASLAGSRHLGLHWTGVDSTPFFRVVRLRKGWFGKVKEDYGPRQPGRGAAHLPVPPVLLEEAQDDPASVLEKVTSEEQPPFVAPSE